MGTAAVNVAESQQKFVCGQIAHQVVHGERPNFAGTWALVRIEGDMDTWMADFGNGWLLRSAAKLIGYGVGRVETQCQQDGDDLMFSRVMCDPSKSEKSQHRFTVGQGTSRFLGDWGWGVSTSVWEGNGLRQNIKAEEKNMPDMNVLVYINDAGEFVEEIVSPKGTLVKNIFERRA